MKENLEKINKKIQENLPLGQPFPKVIAVSKKQDEEKIRQLHGYGVLDFAENYVQEAIVKIEKLKDLGLCWHYIGQLQKKKVKDIVGNFEYIHSLDRIDIAEKISQKANEKNIIQKVLVQVNVSSEETKLGIKPKEFLNFIKKLKNFENLKLCGLMVFPPLCKNDEESLHWFGEGLKLFNQAKTQSEEGFEHLSMGTSQDYHLATQAGSNMLRIGEELMGKRNTNYQ